MLKNKVFTIILLLCASIATYAQAGYEREIYEDAIESGSGGIKGIIYTLIFFGVCWLIIRYRESNEAYKEKEEQRKYYMDRYRKDTSELVRKNTNISKYQDRDAWQKGFATAWYESIHLVKDRREWGKTSEDIIAEYRELCEQGHMVQAESVMEKIGYYESMEFRQRPTQK